MPMYRDLVVLRKYIVICFGKIKFNFINLKELEFKGANLELK
jgi:hypothetical protein